MPDAVPVRRRAPRGQGAALREEVLNAAIDLLAETGSEEAVSLRAVAQRVGVSVPSIYLHFADKKALLDAVCEQVFAALDVAMTQAAAIADDPFQGLRRMGVAYVRFARDHPEQYRIVMMRPDARHAADEAAAKHAAAGDAFQHLLDGVAACLATGVLEGDPVTLGLQLWSATHGVASLLIAKPDFPWPPLEDFVDATICAAGLGLAAGTRLPDGLALDDVVRRLEGLR